jgi:hypothetical protein
MQDSLLLNLFLQLAPQERRRLRKWLASPFFNHREDVQQLFAYLEKYAEQPAALQKERVWGRLFPTAPYDEVQISHLMSFLLKQIKQYLAYAEWQNDPADVQLRLCYALRAHDAPVDMIEKELETGAEILEKQPYRDAQHHFQNMLLQRERYEHTSLLKRNAVLPLVLHNASLETGFLLQIIRHACTMQNFKNIQTEQAPNLLSQQVLANISAAHLEQPLVRLYYHLHQCLEQPESEALFFSVKADLQQYGTLLREKERRDIYLLAINYCIRRLNTGRHQFWQEAFDLYNGGLENRSLFENGVLSKFTYINAVSVGIGMKNFAWVRQFIDTYRPFLPIRERDSIYNYSLAVYYFRLPDYDAAMSLLNQVDFDHDPLAQLNGRTMLLRIYYEKKYTDALESLLDSFSIFLRRQRNVGYQRAHFQNLIQFTRRLLALSPGDKGGAAALKTDIEHSKSVAEKEWLLEKVLRVN